MSSRLARAIARSFKFWHLAHTIVCWHMTDRSMRTFVMAIAFGLSVPSLAAAQRRTSWSPDGQLLAFTLGDKDSTGIFVMNVDGTGRRRVYASGRRDSYPGWTPDGKRIAFASNAGGGDNIYVVDLDGTNLRQLTRDAGRNSYPSWSRNGKEIAFMSNRSGKWQIFLMKPDGSAQRQITHSTGNDYNPEWSHNGKSLVFESDRDGNDQDKVYAIDANGRHERRITTSAANDIFPAWSPDGKLIAYCSVANRRAVIRLIRPDGQDDRVLVEDGCLPSWSPRGDRLAFERGRGEPGIYIVKVSGTEARRISP